MKHDSRRKRNDVRFLTIKGEYGFVFLIDYIEYQIVIYSMNPLFKLSQGFSNKKDITKLLPSHLGE